MGAPEHAIEAYLQKQCEKQNILCKKFESPSTRGYPDRILIHHGTVVFVELKRPGEKPRKLQMYRIEELISHGANVEVADTRQKVDNILNKYW